WMRTLLPGDLRDVPSTQGLVAGELGLLHDHQVPALGERRIRSEGRFDFRGELHAHRGITIGAELVLVYALQDRQPRRHAAEDLAIAHGEAIDDAARIAERDRPDTLLHRLLDVRQVLLPATGLARLLEERVVHDRTTAGLRQTAEQPILELRVGAAAALDHARAGLAQDIG